MTSELKPEDKEKQNPLPSEEATIEELLPPEEPPIQSEDVVLVAPAEVEVASGKSPVSIAEIGEDTDEKSEDSSTEEEEHYYPDAFAKDELVRHRAHVWELRKSNINGFENLLLTLSSATLIFTLTYIKNVIDTKVPVHPLFIKGAWVCLGLAIFFILLSYLLGLSACDRDVDIYVQRYYYNKKKTNPISPWLHCTHWIAGTCFILGIGLTITFACFNYTGVAPDSPAISSKSIAGQTVKPTPMAEVKIIQKNVVIDPNDPNSAIKGGFGPKPTPLPPSPPKTASPSKSEQGKK